MKPFKGNYWKEFFGIEVEWIFNVFSLNLMEEGSMRTTCTDSVCLQGKSSWEPLAQVQYACKGRVAVHSQDGIVQNYRNSYVQITLRWRSGQVFLEELDSIFKWGRGNKWTEKLRVGLSSSKRQFVERESAIRQTAPWAIFHVKYWWPAK